jgi:hypothetical protein
VDLPKSFKTCRSAHLERTRIWLQWGWWSESNFNLFKQAQCCDDCRDDNFDYTKSVSRPFLFIANRFPRNDT